MTIAAGVLALFGGAAPSPEFHSPTELQAWLTYSHRAPRPELVVAALVALESELPRHGSPLEAEAARGGMRSFFGHVLAKSPDAVVEVEGHPFAPGTRRFVAEALWRCGTKACASALARWGVEAASPAPDIRAVPVDSRSAIDDLWASYSATGDRAYVERVIAALPASPDAPDARELRVQAAFTEGPSGGGLVFEDGMGRYVREAQVASGRTWTVATVEDDTLRTTACRLGCRVRYRFELDEAARGARNRNSAFAQGGALVAAPSAWLIRPAVRGPGRYRLRVTTPAGISFATGIFPAGPGTYEADLADLPEAPYSAFGPFETAHIRVTGGEVEVAVLPGEAGGGRAALLAWVERAGDDVAPDYGPVPPPRALGILIPGGRRAVGFGTTMGNGGGSIMIWVGAAASETDLRRDWVLTHEMVHLGLPNLPRAQHWMEEGLATYVEPIARARHGHLTVEEVWTDLVRRTPQGVPGAGGLDANHR